jgi:hypothetical protein
MTQATLERPAAAPAVHPAIAAAMAAYDANPDAYRDELLAMLAPPQRSRRLNRQSFKGQPGQ